MLDCPLYILTVDPKPFDDLDPEKVSYIERWKELADQHSADAFIIKDNEKDPFQKWLQMLLEKKMLLKSYLAKLRKVAGSKSQKGLLLTRY